VVGLAESSTVGQSTLNVFAAASLTEAFAEMGQRFEAEHPNVRVVLNLAGSQQLAQQLVHGAPADLFASADDRQMQVAIEAGRVTSGTEKEFARNQLTIAYRYDNPAAPTTLHDLARPGLRLVLAAEECPAGQYTLDFLGRTSGEPTFGPSFRDSVLANAVSYEQSVRAVLTKIVLGEGDVGIVYASDVSGDLRDEIAQLEIPQELNSPAKYPIAPITDSAQPELARAFIQLVLSTMGQEILAKHGFSAVQ
jgi:molybdate transport system substrate-binding protein